MEAAYVRLRDKAHSIAIARTGLRKNFVAGVLARAGGAEIEERGGIYVPHLFLFDTHATRHVQLHVR